MESYRNIPATKSLLNTFATTEKCLIDMEADSPLLIKPSLDLLDKKKLGYKKLRQFFCKKNNYPRLLFKYKDFNRQHLEDYIVKSSLYLSSFSELNDPYDCKSQTKFSRDGKDRLKYLLALKKANNTNYATTKKMNAQLGGPEELEKRINIARQGIVNTTGIKMCLLISLHCPIKKKTGTLLLSGNIK